VYVTDGAGRILDANPAFLRMFGVRSLRALRRLRAEQLLVDPARRRAELEVLATEGAVREFELDIRRPDGEVRTVLDTAYQVTDFSTGETLYHGILVDITDRKLLEYRLVQAALRDPLTGCFNRRYLMERERELAAAEARWGVVVIDVDHFKQYNDRYGHDVGDNVLVRVGRFLMGTVRAEDAVIRTGGDEFLLFVQGSNVGSLAEVARRLGELGPDSLPVSLSCGWATREGEESLEQTYRRADHDMITRRRGSQRRRQPDRRGRP
jgi:diguanylate cyclase (GGDEF)-like protein/PAS domain S-box-containing protein